ncbi:MAG: hypothetical protein NZM10_03635 [Fimbriimonadales bacterium]|nr:hypothetical protein [Fimbriimonadales bacterium]
MRGWYWLALLALIVGQTPTAGWRHGIRASRCDVAVCKCRDCAGGAHCCCAQAQTPLQQTVALFQCDRAEQQQWALALMPRVVATAPLNLPLPALIFLPYCPLQLKPLSRSVVPRSPPPRRSFKPPSA